MILLSPAGVAAGGGGGGATAEVGALHPGEGWHLGRGGIT